MSWIRVRVAGWLVAVMLLGSGTLAASSVGIGCLEPSSVASTLALVQAMDPKPTRETEPRAALQSESDAARTAKPGPGDLASPPNFDSARQLLRSGQWSEALALADSALQAGNLTTAWCDLKSEALLRGGQISAAKEWARSEREDACAGARSWTVLARIAAARGFAERAGKQIERALLAAPKDPEVLYWGAELSADREQTLSLMQRYLDSSAGESEFRVQAVRSALAGLQARKAAGRAVWQPKNQPEELNGKLRRLKNDAGLAGWIVDLRLGARQKKVPVLFDTGSSGLFLSRRVAKRVGTRFEVDRKLSGSESRRVTQGVLERFALEQLVFEDATVKSVDVELDPLGRFSGVMGLLPLRSYRVTLDPAQGRWRAERGAAATSREDSDAKTEQPYWWFSGLIVIELEWRPGRKGLFLVDTGAQRSMLAASMVDLEISGELWIRSLGGFRQAGRSSEVLSLSWQGASTRASEGLPVLDLSAESQASGVELAGVLGLDLLSQGVLTLDPDGQRLIWKLNKLN